MTERTFDSVPGTGPLHPVLTVSSASNFASELSFTVSSGHPVGVLLEPRYTRLFLSLIAAWHADAARGTTWRGWRTRRQIGMTFRGMPLADGPVDADTVKHYVCAIRRSIRRAVRAIDARLDWPDPIETRPSARYRIGKLGLTVAWEDSGPDVEGRQSGHQGVPARTHRGAPILVHLPVHRAIEASASSSGSKEASL